MSKIVKKLLLNFIQGACGQKIPPSFESVHFLNVKTNAENFETLSFNNLSIADGKPFVKCFPPLWSHFFENFFYFFA